MSLSTGFMRPRQFMLAPRNAALVLATLAMIVSLSAFLHLQAIVSSTGASFDIDSFALQASSVLHHQNVYVVTTRYPYPPVWIWIVAAASWLANGLALPFDQVVKIPAMLGDLGILVLAYLYMRDRFGVCLFALVPAVLYAVNPVVLLISAGHGQFDALVLFCILLAIHLRGTEDSHRPIWSALALGVAIALKGYPVLVLPYFALTAPHGRRLATLALAFIPLVAACIVYVLIFGYSSSMITHVLAYPSTPDGGWASVLGRGVPAFAQTFGTYLRDVSDALIVALVMVVPGVVFRRAPATAVTLIFGIFLAVTYTMSVQYMIWILPFLCLALPYWALVYTAPALAALAGFYAGLFTGAIPRAALWPALVGWLAPARPIGVMGVILVAALICAVCLYAAVSTSAPRTALGAVDYLRRPDASADVRAVTTQYRGAPRLSSNS